MSDKKQDIAAADALAHAFRELASADVLYNAAVAERLQINSTALRCLSYLDARGTATAGQLVRWSGLTSGAITGVVNRLERAGLVRREPDPDDARRVRLSPVGDSREHVERLMEPLGRQLAEVAERLTPSERATLTQFVREAIQIIAAETRRIRILPDD